MVYNPEIPRGTPETPEKRSGKLMNVRAWFAEDKKEIEYQRIVSVNGETVMGPLHRTPLRGTSIQSPEEAAEWLLNRDKDKELPESQW